MLQNNESCQNNVNLIFVQNVCQSIFCFVCVFGEGGGGRNIGNLIDLCLGV